MQRKFKTSKEVTEKFWELEEELDLFNLKIAGVYIWERVRFGLHKEIEENLGFYGQGQNVWKKTFPDKVLWLFRTFFSAIFKNPLFSSPKEILFFGHSRRKLLKDRKWWDIYCDPVISFLEDKECLLLESPYLKKHLRPSKTSSVGYLDYIELILELKAKLGLGKICFSAEESRVLSEINFRLNQEFGLEVNVNKIIRARLLRRERILPVYRRLLKSLSPRTVFLVVSYGKEELLEVCKSLGITTVEFQHGTIDRYHLGYSYPQGTATKRAFPDYFLTFGDFWKNLGVIPLPSERIIPVGYPFFEEEIKKHLGSQKKKQILFISQGTIGKELSKFAVELTKSLDDSITVIYKLHPGEYKRWRDEYSWLVKAQEGGIIRVEEDGEGGLYKLMAESKVQVGVYSTAIYEGLSFGLKTYLVPLSGIEYMRELLEKGYAKEVESVEDLVQELQISDDKVSFDSEDFFKSNSLENFSQFLSNIEDNNLSF
jgi:hypothetical protein